MASDTGIDAGIRPLVTVAWAPVLIEPVLGSGERITVAAAAVDETGNARCVRAIRPDVVRTVFGDRASHVTDMVDLIVTSLDSWLGQAQDFRGWTPPLEGVSLGPRSECYAKDVDVVLGRALPMVAFLFREPSEATLRRPATWHRTVADGLRARGERYAHSVNAKVHLAGRDVPATFTFLSPSYATNVVAFDRGSTENMLREAKWKAWNLDRLGDAPSYLFKPAVRELIAGLPAGAPASHRQRWEDALGEIEEEASRRDLGVVSLPTPASVIEHILERENAING